MKKANCLRSSNFWMSDGDELHILIEEISGVTATFTLNTEYADGTTNQFDAPDPPIAISASDITSSGFTANWNYSENAQGYYLDVAEDSGFTSMVVGYDNLNVGFVNEYGVSGLDDAITYYYRLRAYNDYGTSIDSNTITLTTDVELVVDADGNVYTYVTIGTQQWMVENFRSTKYADTTAIPNLTLDADWIADATGASCYYNNDIANKADYGALYNWYAVDNAHGLAPAGWRVPSVGDWNTLTSYVGGSSVAGGKLKEAGIGHWITPNTGADNYYGFTALPSGYRGSDGLFYSINYNTYLQSTDDADEAVRISYSTSDIDGGYGEAKMGYAVRLMRDI